MKCGELSRVPPGRGGHGLDHLSIVQAIEVSLDEHRGHLERLDAELDDLADPSRERLQP
jgi:hypothetical protein